MGSWRSGSISSRRPTAGLFWAQ